MILIREFELDDLENGFIETVSEKWKTTISKNNIKNILKNNNRIFVVIDTLDNSDIFVGGERGTPVVIGTATLHLQYKFIHNCCICGFIEDVIIRKEYRNQGIGKKLILELINQAKILKCYKIILSCQENLINFYEKCGFDKKEASLKKYL
jgi:glucosamine-phosphate N-acetyltransferase